MGLNSIATQQYKEKDLTATLVHHLLSYCATYPDAKLTFSESGTILHIHTDASFLSEPRAKSRGGGYVFLPSDTQPPNDAPHNGPIYCFFHILKKRPWVCSRGRAKCNVWERNDRNHHQKQLLDLACPVSRVPYPMKHDEPNCDAMGEHWFPLWLPGPVGGLTRYALSVKPRV